MLFTGSKKRDFLKFLCCVANAKGLLINLLNLKIKINKLASILLSL